MNKNTVIGGLLIVIIMVGWMTTVPKQQAQTQAQPEAQKTEG